MNNSGCYVESISSDLDEDLTAKKSRMQRWKNDKMKFSIRKAYQYVPFLRYICRMNLIDRCNRRAKEETTVDTQNQSIGMEA